MEVRPVADLRECAGFILAVGALCSLVACGGDPESPTPLPPPPKVTVTLATPESTTLQESENPRLRLTVELDPSAYGAVTVGLNFGGSAERDSDYDVSSDTIEFAVGAASGSVEIDVYRDFDEEGDETIEVSLGSLTGNAESGEPSSVTLTLADGEAAVIRKGPEDDGEEQDIGPTLLPLAFALVDDPEYAVVALVLPQFPGGSTESQMLVGQWSTDSGFASDVHTIATYEITPSDDPFEQVFGNLREFRLPVGELAPSEHYFVRAYLGSEPPATGPGVEAPNLFYDGFATDAEGRVAVRCKPGGRDTSAGGGDPLFAHQWHLDNTGQSAFADRGGAPGADLGMTDAIAAGRNGAGVKLAVVDTGLEICHPDLAANTRAGGSFNFGFARMPGAARHDPFNFSLLGDHGTSVAGIAAAAASNGTGGRGVAPEVTLVGFNPASGFSEEDEDPELALPASFLKSLGAGEGADGEPDSASVDIFNMSFGSEAPSENAAEEFVRLLKMGTTRLRGGRGALYVKAAGNGFADCEPTHPFQKELGCVNSNTDPDQNLPWLINVGGFNADDVKSSYSAAGANLWVVGPAGEDGVEAPAMITTDQAGTEAGYSQFPQNRLNSAHSLNRNGDYVSAFGGTSSAAPAVAGVIAVLLGAYPELTWREARHILAASARKIDPGIAEVRAAFNGNPYVAQHAWRTNAADYEFHNWYGFGAVDLDAALAMAAVHVAGSLGELAESDWFAPGGDAALPLSIPDADGAGASAVIEVTGLPETASIEAAVLEITVEHTNAFDLGVSLRSPGEMENVINPPLNSVLEGYRGMQNWRLLSNAFYGENPNGNWTVHVADIAPGDTGSVTGLRLKIYHAEHSQD